MRGVLRRVVGFFLIAAVLSLVMQALDLLSVFQIEIPLIIAIAVGGAAIAEVAFPTWQARFERESALRDEQARAIREGCFTLPSGKLPQVRQLSDPLAWGVHPTAASSGSDVVPFVPRDVDEELRAQLTKNAFVLVVGDSTAGKSRCAFEAVRAVLPRHTLIIPTAVGSIAATLKAAERYSRCVLWLDDINRWFASPELTREAISQLLTPGKRRHRVVVATLRAAEADNWSTMPEEATALDTYRKVQDLLKLARLFRLDRLFSPAERERARDYVSDARIADALEHADEYGLAEYLANGPQRWEEWQNAWSVNTNPQAPTHPRGAALVAAAVDLRRAGYVSPIPRALLEEVHGIYLEQRGGERLNPEPLARAWRWATSPREGTTRLLTPYGAERVDVFDYLVDEVQRRTPAGNHVPDQVIVTALVYASAADARSIGTTAYAQGRYRLAERAYRQAYNADLTEHGLTHPDTLTSRNNLALVLQGLGRLDEAETEHRAVLEARRRTLGDEHPHTLTSRNNLASVLRELGRPDEAEEI